MNFHWFYFLNFLQAWYWGEKKILWFSMIFRTISAFSSDRINYLQYFLIHSVFPPFRASFLCHALWMTIGHRTFGILIHSENGLNACSLALHVVCFWLCVGAYWRLPTVVTFITVPCLHFQSDYGSQLTRIVQSSHSLCFGCVCVLFYFMDIDFMLFS